MPGLYKQLKIKDDFAFTLEGISEVRAVELILQGSHDALRLTADEPRPDSAENLALAAPH